MGASSPLSPPARARHFEGWQLGLLAVGLAALSAWLALPRPVEPDEVPLPLVDRQQLARGRANDVARAELALKRQLPFAARAVGELVRRHGRLVALGNGQEANLVRAELRAQWAAARKELGAEQLAQLRAIQAELWLNAVEQWQRTGKPSAELDELGGGFPQKAKRMGWADEQGKLRLSATEQWVLFVVRWSELVGAIRDPSLRPSLDQFRLYYHVLLRHPGGDEPAEQDEARLAYVRALSQIDGSFPSDLARGVLLYRLGRAPAALAAFTGHLATHPNGPWTLRCKNYGLAALAASEDSEVPAGRDF